MKPWVFTLAPYMNSSILGIIGPGFLNRVPTVAVLREPTHRKTERKHHQKLSVNPAARPVTAAAGK